MGQGDRIIVTVGVVVLIGMAIAVNRGGHEGPSPGNGPVATAESKSLLRSTRPAATRHFEPESAPPPLLTNPAQVNAALNPDSALTDNPPSPDVSVTPNPYIAGQGEINADTNPYVAGQIPDPATSNPSTADAITASPAPEPDRNAFAASADSTVLPTDPSDQELLDRMMSTLSPDQRDDFRATWWTMDAEDRQEWLLYLRYTLGDVTRQPSPGGSN